MQEEDIGDLPDIDSEDLQEENSMQEEEIDDGKHMEAENIE